MNDFEQLISIIIPVRTLDFLLEKCITKIREYYPKVNIVVIYDEFQNNDNIQKQKYITYLKSTNKNMSAKRNQGVNNCNTEYIAFLDSDAYPCENWIEEGLSFLRDNQNYSAVTGNQFNTPEDNFEQKCLRLVRFSPLFTHEEWLTITDKNINDYDCKVFMTSNVIMRRKDYTDIKGMNEEIYLAEDNEFSKRLIENDYKIRFIPKVSVYHRESKLYPFLRKIYCMSYYYANMFIKGKPVKDFKQSIAQFIPLIGLLLFILLWIILYKIQINPFILLFLPFIAFLILIKEAIYTSNKLNNKKLKGFFLILFTYCAFCFIWIIGTFLGLINFPSKDIQKLYRQY